MSHGHAGSVQSQRFKAPTAGELLMELRAGPEFAAFLAAWPMLASAPRGDGHTVLVLPPFAASDQYTSPLRSLLGALGYQAEGWELGHNLGRTSAVVDGVPRRLLELHERTGEPVSIVGWSMGGVLARELAREHPAAVRQVIGLSAPFLLKPEDTENTHGALLYELVRHLQEDPTPEMLLEEHVRGPLPVPYTAVYSRTDGVVDWNACVERVGRHAENVEVHGSHCGLGHNPAALIVVLDRLAQPLGQWSPFVAPRGTRCLFPRTDTSVAA